MAVVEYNIALRYSSTNIESVAFDEEAEDQILLDCTTVILNDEAEKVNIKTLRGRKAQHILGRGTNYNITITSDQLDEQVISDLKDWWFSGCMYIAVMNDNGVVYSDTDVVYKGVIDENKDFPLSYIDNNRHFPEINFKLTQKVNEL